MRFVPTRIAGVVAALAAWPCAPASMAAWVHQPQAGNAGAAARLINPSIETLREIEKQIETVEGAERETAIDQAIELRRKLLPTLPKGEAVTLDMIYDQAAALLARLARDGSDTSVLVGLADVVRRESVSECLVEVSAMLDGLPRQYAPLRELLVRGRAGILQAAIETTPARSKQALLKAREAFRDAEPLCRSEPQAAAFRRISEAIAVLAEGGKQAPALALKIAGEPLIEEQPTRLEQQAVAVLAAGRLGKLDEALAAIDTGSTAAESLERILVAEIGARALAERGKSDNHPELYRRACERLTTIAEMDLAGVSAGDRQKLAERSLGALLDRFPEAGAIPELPPLARLVQADRQAVSDLAKAREAYDELARDGEVGEIGGEALWRSARSEAVTADPQRLPRLLRVVREFPGHPRAGQAMTTAIDLLNDAKNLQGDAAKQAEQIAQRQAALELATTRFAEHPSINPWRLQLAKLYADNKDWKGAIAQLDRVPKDAEEAGKLATSGIQRVLLDGMKALWAEVDQARVKLDDAAVKSIARYRILPLARRGRDALASRLPAEDTSLIRLRADVADAIVESGEGDARDQYKNLMDEAASVPGGAARLRLGLARAKLIMNEPEAGFADLKQLVSDLQAADSKSTAYWHAWTLMLETIVQKRTKTEQASAGRAHLAKLRTQDPTLGGEPWKTRLERAEAALSK